MAGPLSAPAGHRQDPAGPKDGPHGRCQDRGNCTGPGCRVRTGKTYHKRTGTPSVRAQAELAAVRKAMEAAEAENQEIAA